MTELEERLTQPDGDELRKSLERHLVGIAQRLHAHLSGGVPRDEYANWQAAAGAVVAAQEVLQTWVRGEENVGCNL